jgi:hypothetical protein
MTESVFETMAVGAHTDPMTTIVPIPVDTVMRRSLTGALAGDRVVPERPRRRVRQPRRALQATGRAPVTRTPAPASRS